MFHSESVISTLLKIVFALVILYLIVIVDRFIFTEIKIIPSSLSFLIDLDRESNFPSYFSSALLLFCAVLLAVIYQKFLSALPSKVRRGILLTGGIYISDTIGNGEWTLGIGQQNA